MFWGLANFEPEPKRIYLKSANDSFKKDQYQEKYKMGYIISYESSPASHFGIFLTIKKKGNMNISVKKI